MNRTVEDRIKYEMLQISNCVSAAVVFGRMVTENELVFRCYCGAYIYPENMFIHQYDETDSTICVQQVSSVMESGLDSQFQLGQNDSPPLTFECDECTEISIEEDPYELIIEEYISLDVNQVVQ